MAKGNDQDGKKSSRYFFPWCLLVSATTHGIVGGVALWSWQSAGSWVRLAPSRESASAVAAFLVVEHESSATDEGEKAAELSISTRPTLVSSPLVSSPAEIITAVPPTAVPTKSIPAVQPPKVRTPRAIDSATPVSQRRASVSSHQRAVADPTIGAAGQQSTVASAVAPPPTPSAGLVEVSTRMVTRVEYSSNPPPRYPDEARRRRLSGTVILEVTVDGSGHVVEVRMGTSSGHAVLDEAAQMAVSAWHFTPATVAGTAVSSRVRVPISFELR